jgi:peptidoglycan/LPS O-acetylase OafA/YrhL
MSELTHPTAIPASVEQAKLTRHRRALGALTGIRFVAAMQVVFVHHGSGFVARLYAAAPVVDLGWLAAWNSLTFFYLLSGFILAYTYAGQMHGPGHKRRFWEARFARVYPVYLLALVVSYPFSRPGIGAVLACLFMVQSWDPFHPYLATAWNFTAWSLSCEAFFYIVFPWFLYAFEKLSPRVMRYILAALVLFIVFGHTTLADPSSIHSTLLAAIFRWTPTPIRRLPEFLVGIALGLLFLKDPRKSGRNWLLWTAIVLDIVLLGTLHGLWISLLVIPDVVLLYELAHGGTGLARLLSTGPLLLLGGASYSVYLLQFPVRNLERFLFSAHAAKSSLPALVYPLLLIAVSILVFLYFEEPCRRTLRLWFARTSTTSGPPPPRPPAAPAQS